MAKVGYGEREQEEGMERVGVGILTHNRPELFKQVVEAAHQHLGNVVWRFYIHNDASDEQHRLEYERVYAGLHGNCGIVHDTVQRGTAKAKNQLMRRMLRDKCDWLFLCEDDCLVLSEKAVTGYIDAAKEAGVQHLTFLSDNPDRGEPAPCDTLTFWQFCSAQWTMYYWYALDKAGLFDEAFYNCLYDVEHTLRLAKHGLTVAGRRKYPDATGSDSWLRTLYVPSVLGRSTLEYATEYLAGKAYWKQTYPETYLLIDWGDDDATILA